eukprot:COSAG02_NODE_10700_length_1881_cov_1.002806_4_plen_47_part_01
MPLVGERAKLGGNCVADRAPQCSVESSSLSNGLREGGGAITSTVDSV